MHSVLTAYTASAFQIPSCLLPISFFTALIAFTAFLTLVKSHFFVLVFISEVSKVILLPQITGLKAKQLLGRSFILLCWRSLRENCLHFPFKALFRVLFDTARTSLLSQSF